MTHGKTKVVTRLHLVSKRPKGKPPRWYVYAWRGGPCIHKAVGERPIITPAILDAAAQARLTRTASRNTFDSIIDGYRDSPEFDRLQPATKRDYRLWLTRASERFGKAPIVAFTDYRMRGDIIGWRDTWAAQPRTADKATVTMAMLLGWAQERGMLPVNVAAGIRQMNIASNRADAVWEPHHWQAVEALDENGEPIIPAHVMDALKLASMTGLRLGDLLRLDWESVGDQAIILTTRKRKSRAVIPILPELRAWLDARKGECKGIILRNSRGQPWTESGFETVWQRRKPAGFDRRIHDLRGSYVTWLAIKGLTDEEIARTVSWTAKRVGEIRARYVDEARVVVSLVARLSA